MGLKKYLPFLNMFDHLHLAPKDSHLNLGESEASCHHSEEPRSVESGDATAATDICDDTIDDVILAQTGECNEHLLDSKELLVQHMVKVKQWWDDEGWFGKQDSKLRKQLREACSELLESLGFKCQCPVLLMTLELMFSTKAGFGKSVRTVPYPCSATLKNFLLKLQPFGIEKLYTANLQFECPSVVTICKNSPLIKWIHLRIEFAKGEILREIGHTAPGIETVIVVVREYEIYEEISSTVEIVIVGGEGLEDNLYTGFFDGLDKNSVNHKIQNDEDMRISFPKLKYVDVGSHRDVREFLHHLLYAYPDIRCITCNSENWVLSKYSFDFPPVTPSTLGRGPKSLRKKTPNYNLREMNFSSFCLASKLRDIFTKYRKLEHVGLHLLKGPWKIKSTSETAKELLCTINCKYLTICADVYMSNDDLLSLYIPSLQATGSSLRILQFHLTNEVNVKVLCQLINMCQFIEELSLVTSCERCEVEGEDTDEIHINELSRLKCLSISSPYNVTDALYLLSQRLIFSATNLITLELELGGRKVTEWLMEIASRGALESLEIFHINLPSYKFDTLTISNFFLPLINLLPHLSCLMLSNVCFCVVHILRARYQFSNLRIISRTSSYLAFRSLSSRCC
ncbi:uncharacterized protein [Procambarus clarkii]|uniref:uncharacterized protein n=1 Tax=Procambarus clarkii TaxID=6728 RepID=UPI0037442F14